MNSGPDFNVGRFALRFVPVMAAIFIVPILVYGAASPFTGMSVPGGSPTAFLTGVFISKMGTAFAFVTLFSMASNKFSVCWRHYALVWWTMFAFNEIGQAIGPGYSWEEAVAGIISEAIYFPLSSYICTWGATDAPASHFK